MQAYRPSPHRYLILGLLCLLAMITYMDRAANGSAKSAIMKDLNDGGSNYTTDDFFYVLMAFQLAYALFEIPSGWLGDTFGPRSTLLRIVLWWSVFVALTGFTGMTIGPVTIGFGALIVIQFLFGMGEAGAFPNIAKALYNWFPSDERGTAKSIVWMSARFMGGLTPLLWVLLVEIGGLSWRDAMWLFAGVAILWCVAFFILFRNKPPIEHDPNAAATKRGVVAVPWGKLVRSRNLWLLCCMYVVTNFCWYFLMYDLPGRLKSQFPDWNATDGGKIQLALLAGAPLLVGMFGCLTGGIVSDYILRRTGNRVWARRGVGMAGYGLAGLFYLTAASSLVYAPANVLLFAGLLIAMGFCNDLMMAPAWAAAQDIGREYSATVSGAMNMFGNLVGAVSGIFFTGTVIKAFPGNDGILYCFVTYAAVYFVGVVLWRFIDVSKPIVADDPPSVA